MTDDSTTDFGGIPDSKWDELSEVAREIQPNAYANYSDFPVGAALLTEDGEIIPGCNVENATIGATVCAERTAVGTAVTQGHREFAALCVISSSTPPAVPCGICRQVLVEFCEDLPIMAINQAGDREFTTLKELLPKAFRRIPAE